MVRLDVAIPIVFPDYLIRVDTPPLKIELPVTLPGLGGKIEIPGTKNKVPYLGHAGILFIDGNSGTTKYYEYGRYDPAALGLVRKQSVPNVRLAPDGRFTLATMRATLATISSLSGQSGRILGAYIELTGGAYAKMLKYAASRMALNSNPKRAPYELLSNSCMHFMKDTAIAGGAIMPGVFDPRPAGYIDKVRDDFPDLDFKLPSTLTIEGITLK
jgi:hypothetical protein